ncbi:ABC transporter substrate-binding protein [Pararhizobium haloflavum]|uniref:ABC transporter substrate-binding protein n=1 Tax=Pararhizobium haloflavum TaxID=2037914 RepID=UPI000C1A6B05|nr:ABC transporter substrate-binding protein [Pararhizobium haloflavum]
MTNTRLTLGVALGAMVAASAASGAELRFSCYQDGVECDVWAEQLKQFEEENPDITVAVEVVPYQSILESLPVNLASGDGPDLARVTDFGGLAEYMLNVRDYVEDPESIEDRFGASLDWARVGGNAEDGIYVVVDQLTATGPFVNKTLFDQAGVEMPGEGATWEEWAEASRQVAEATQSPYAMAMDRSGHRFMGPAISYGAEIFQEDGAPITVDDGFRAFAEQFVAWHEDGTMAMDVWAGAGGATYQDAAQEFINGSLVFYLSGSWQIARFGRDIGDAFDWVAVPSPCGEVGCTGIPGGAGIVGFNHTEHPEEVGKLLEFIARDDVQAAVMAATKNIPASRTLQEEGIDYANASDQERAALEVFSSAVIDFSPVAYAFQGYANNRAIMNSTVERLTQAIVGEVALDAALERIDQDVAEAVEAAE